MHVLHLVFLTQMRGIREPSVPIRRFLQKVLSLGGNQLEVPLDVRPETCSPSSP